MLVLVHAILLVDHKNLYVSIHHVAAKYKVVRMARTIAYLINSATHTTNHIR